MQGLFPVNIRAQDIFFIGVTLVIPGVNQSKMKLMRNRDFKLRTQKSDS